MYCWRRAPPSRDRFRRNRLSLPRRLRPELRRPDRPRSDLRSRPAPHLHRPRHGALRPRPQLRRAAVHLGPRAALPSPRPPRRPLLPPLRAISRRRRLRPRHLPHRPPPRRGNIRSLPDTRPYSRLHERPGRGRHRDTLGGVVIAVTYHVGEPAAHALQPSALHAACPPRRCAGVAPGFAGELRSIPKLHRPRPAGRGGAWVWACSAQKLCRVFTPSSPSSISTRSTRQ